MVYAVGGLSGRRALLLLSPTRVHRRRVGRHLRGARRDVPGRAAPRRRPLAGVGGLIAINLFITFLVADISVGGTSAACSAARGGWVIESTATRRRVPSAATFAAWAPLTGSRSP
jgi:hypothetical protein